MKYQEVPQFFVSSSFLFVFAGVKRKTATRVMSEEVCLVTDAKEKKDPVLLM